MHNVPKNRNKHNKKMEHRAGWREWLGLAVLALPTILLALDFTVLHLALPHLAEELKPDSNQQLWIVDIYGFMIAGFLITMGSLGDRIGRRRLLMIGSFAFGIASIVAAYSTSPEMLIVTRALLGIAGATLMPSTLSLISNMFQNPQQRATAIAIWLSCFSAGGAVGPIIGGIMLEFFWWGSVFLMGVPVMILLLITAPLLLPEYSSSRANRIDLMSVVLSLATILPIIYGFKGIAKDGWQLSAAIAILIGILMGVWFVIRQKRLTEPLLDLNLFNNRVFSGALSCMLLGIMTLGAFVLLFSQYLQLVAGLTPIQAGGWLIPYTLANIVGAIVSPLFAYRIRPAYVIAFGLLIAGIGYLFLTHVNSSSHLITMMVSSIFITFGLSPLMVLTTDIVVGSAPPENTGSVSSLSESCSELGMALGVATLGALGNLIYRDQVSQFLTQKIPSTVAIQFQESLAGAVTATAQLPHDLRIELLAIAKKAFTTGLNFVAVASAVIVFSLAVLSWILLRNVPTSEENENLATASNKS